jgi:hypothetical protein
MRLALYDRPPLPHALFAVIIEKRMSNRRLVFAVFAAAILFSTIREWSAPAACLRAPVARNSSIVIAR